MNSSFSIYTILWIVLLHIEKINPTLRIVPLHIERINPTLRIVPLHIERINPALRIVPLHIKRINPTLRIVPPHIERTNPTLRIVPLHIKRTNPILRLSPNTHARVASSDHSQVYRHVDKKGSGAQAYPALDSSHLLLLHFTHPFRIFSGFIRLDCIIIILI